MPRQPNLIHRHRRHCCCPACMGEYAAYWERQRESEETTVDDQQLRDDLAQARLERDQARELIVGLTEDVWRGRPTHGLPYKLHDIARWLSLQGEERMAMIVLEAAVRIEREDRP